MSDEARESSVGIDGIIYAEGNNDLSDSDEDNDLDDLDLVTSQGQSDLFSAA